jgi:hypothetical protein
MMVIASLCTDVTKLIFRRPYQTTGLGSFVKSHESSLSHIQAKLSEWKTALPSGLQYTKQKLVEAAQHRHAGSFIAMHALYHISQLKTARNAHHELLSPHTVARQIRLAHSSAIRLLEIVCDIRSTKPRGPGEGQDPVNLLSSIFIYGITAAIDTLSAGGLRKDLERTMMLINDSIATLHDLARFSASAEVQAKQTYSRKAQIELQTTKIFGTRAVTVEPRATNGEGNEDYWRISEPMEKMFDLQQDVSYGTSSTIYFTALREGH